jgi:hypothetical protein
MKNLSLAPIIALIFLSSCTEQCNYGTQMVGRNIAITGPSGGMSGVTLNTGSIQDQKTYALTSQRVTDLVAQMALCCRARQEALKSNDHATADMWNKEQLKAFDQMLDLQKQLPSSNQPSGVGPVIAAAPAPAASPGIPKASPSPGAPIPLAAAGPTTMTAKASEKNVESWLASSKKTLTSLKNKTSAISPNAASTYAR